MKHMRNRSIRNVPSGAQRDRKTIMFPALLLAFLLGSHPATARADEITLESGARLRITEIEYSRILPQSFYDQALSSLPHLFPKHTMLAARRSGNLGKVNYALVCYRDTPSSQRVAIQAVATYEGRAWRLETTSASSYADTLLQVLEQISKLPSYKAAQ